MIRRSRFHQRGMLSGMGVRRASWTDQYTLDAGNGGGVSVTDGSSPYDSHVGIRFLTTGFVQICENTDGGPSWTSHGQWISDTSKITGNEEVRFTNFLQLTGVGNFTTEAAADDTWIAITTTREWFRNQTTAGEVSWECDFEVRDTGAGVGTGTRNYQFLIDNVV